MTNRALPPAPQLLDGRTVARRLKLRAGTLDELVQTGKVRPLDGGLYDLEEVRRVLSGSLTETTIETTVSEDAQSRAIALAVNLADKSQGREGRMFELYTKALGELIEALQMENKALRAEKGELREENSRLHNQLVESSKVRETLLSKQHERDLLTRAMEQKSEHQREAVALLKQALPLVQSHFRAQAGNSLAKQLFESIEPAQIEAILAIDFLSEGQKEILRKLTEERARQLNGAGTAQQNGAVAS